MATLDRPPAPQGVAVREVDAAWGWEGPQRSWRHGRGRAAAPLSSRHRPHRPAPGGGLGLVGGWVGSARTVMELHILEHRVRVLSLARPGLWLYTHPLIKLLFLPRRSRCAPGFGGTGGGGLRCCSGTGSGD